MEEEGDMAEMRGGCGANRTSPRKNMLEELSGETDQWLAGDATRAEVVYWLRWRYVQGIRA